MTINPENALLSRRMSLTDDGRVALEELWDTAHPDCPFVIIGGDRPPNPHPRRVIMSQEQYDELKPSLK